MNRWTDFLCLVVVIFILSGLGCSGDQKQSSVPYSEINGKTMGTYYQIKLQTPLRIGPLKHSIDSILKKYDNELSTYNKASLISKFNQSQTGICVDSLSDFYQSIRRAIALTEATNGYYDPTIAPLVNYWGFGADRQKKKNSIDQDTIDEILKLTGFSNFEFLKENQKSCIKKTNKYQELNLNASAKGKGVDLIADFLTEKGIKNYMVEIGGEVVTRGQNEKGKIWVLGITKPSPKSESADIILPIKLDNKAMATSGNYRQFYQEGTLTFAHIINPKTGLSEPTDLLSTTVIANDCETADAFATAFMSMGKSKAIGWIEKTDSIQACFIFKDSTSDSLDFYFSPGFDHYKNN